METHTSKMVETHKVKICHTCGDAGVVEGIATCNQCQIGEHTYCMRKRCTVLPTNWCCEICSSKKELSEATVNLNTKMSHSPKESAGEKKFSNSAQSNWKEKGIEKGKTKYLSTDEVKKMQSGDIAQTKPKRTFPARSSYTVRSNPSFGPSIHSGKLHSGNTQNKKSVQKVKEMKDILAPTKEHGQIRQISPVQDIEVSHAKKQKGMGETLSASQISRHSKTCDIAQTDATLSPANALTSTGDTEKTNSEIPKKVSREECAALLAVDCQPAYMLGFKPTKNPEPKNSEAENVVHTVKNIFQKAAAEETLPTDPAPVASWMGNFIVKDEKTTISFRAYPTSQGLPKVKEFSTRMPAILEFELMSYKDFLRTVFKGDDPNEEDIGLYFFPDNMQRLESYISHLEQLYGQVVLRSCIGEVDLLVFTSKVLHRDYRRWNKHDFLWGLYRHKRRHQKLDCAVEEKAHEDNVIDMEVDMMGGVAVGSLETVIPRQSLKTSNEMFGAEAAADSKTDIPPPPGFSPLMRRQQNNTPPGPSSLKKRSDIPPPPGFSPLTRRQQNDSPPGPSSLEKGSDILPPPGLSQLMRRQHSDTPSLERQTADIPPGFTLPFKIKQEKNL